MLPSLRKSHHFMTQSDPLLNVTPSDSVLSFQAVSARLADERFSDVVSISFDLPAGQCLSIALAGRQDSPLPGLALGERVSGTLRFETDASGGQRLQRSASNVGMAGRILFAGVDWQERSAYDQLACRGRIGWVFSEPAWVNNLNLLENVLLRPLHHSTVDRAALMTQAQALADQVDLAEIPPARMRQFDRSHLRRAEWVRAFLANPQLILLHRALTAVESVHHSALRRLVQQALERGAAVLWLASDPEELQIAESLSEQRFQMIGTELQPRKVTA